MLLVVALLVAILPSSAVAQTGPTARIRDLVVQPDGTTILRVALPPGVETEGLADAITVRENGVEVDATVDVVEVDSSTVGARVALLLDTSGSTEGAPIEAAKSAAKQFVTDVTERNIPVTLIAFAADRPTPVASESTNAAQLNALIDTFVAEGGTAMNEAIDVAAKSFGEVDPDRQSTIVIFTDGADTESTITVPQAVAAAQEAEATITVVALETGEHDEEALAQLATGTGGTILDVANTAGLAAALQDVATSLTSELLVTYSRPDNFLDPELVIQITADTNVGLLAARKTAANVRTPITTRPPRTVVPTPPVFISGTAALVLGLGSAAIGFVLFGLVLFVAPTNSRSSKVLKRQLAAPREQRKGRSPVDDIKLKERVASVMDAVPKPSGFDAALQLQLDQASWPLRAGEFLALSLGLAVAGLVTGFLLDQSNPVLAFTFAAVGVSVPRLILIQRRQKRAQLFHEQLPDTLQMLAGSLRAGYGLMQGFENVSTEGQPPTASEFGRVLTETRLGIPLEEALAAMAERVGSDDFRWVTVAISIQRKVGGNLAELLDTVAATLREREQVRRQVKVLSAEGKLSAIILVALPIVFALYLGTTRPDYLTPLFNTGIGQTMLGGAVVLMGFGIVWIRNVIKIDV